MSFGEKMQWCNKNSTILFTDDFNSNYIMATSIDEVFMKIGEFRQYQWFLLTLFGYGIIAISSVPIMIASFITTEPDWKCVEGYKNNTVCRFNSTITLTSDDYEARCKMPREAWMFVDDFTSVVTEV